jgi:hypothetical protein
MKQIKALTDSIKNDDNQVIGLDTKIIQKG